MLGAGAAKRVLDTLAARGGAARLARLAHVRQGVVLAYHNIVPDGTPRIGDRSLHLERATFARQLEALSETHEIVPLVDLLAGDPASSLARPRAAISFDDAYAGAVTLGVAELTRRHLPATVFVVPGALEGRLFWWDLLATPEEQGVPQVRRMYALDELAGQHDRVLEWARAAGYVREFPDELRGMLLTATEAELRAAATQPGITLASHTWSHVNLARVAPDVRACELERPLGWLRGRFPNAAPWVSYPYGSWTAAVGQAAATAGYVAGFAVSGGYLRAAHNCHATYALPRLNVPSGASLDRFITLVSGLY